MLTAVLEPWTGMMNNPSAHPLRAAGSINAARDALRDRHRRPSALPGLRASFFAAALTLPETWGESMAAVNRVPMRDNGERLIDPCTLQPEISVAAHPSHGRGRGSCLVRETVARMLAKAQAALPRGYRLQIIEGYRSLEIQRSLFQFACE